jgi:hypothetical protein
MKKSFWVLLLLVVAGFAIRHYVITNGPNLPESEYYSPTQSYYSYRELVSDESKEVYDELERSVYGKPDKEDNLLCEIRDVDKTEAYLGYRAFMADHPDVFWVIRKENLLDQDTMYFCSIYPKEELAEKRKEFRASLEEFLDSVPEGLEREDLEWYANEYLVDLCDYDYTALEIIEDKDSDRDESERLTVQEAGSSYGALVNGWAVCEGYAHAYQVLLNRVGVSCVPINGQGSSLVDGARNGEVDHTWNAVRNGSTWLMTDVTWNDTSGNNSKYFNLPIEEMYRNHNARAIDIENFSYSRVFNFVGTDNQDNIFLPE